MGPKGEVNLAHPQLRWRLKKFPHPTGRIGGCLLVVFQPVTKYFPAGLELRVVEIDRNPEYRDADEPHGGGRNQQHSGLAEWRVENATALKCRMATTFTPRREGHRCDKCLTDEVFEFLLGGTEHDGDFLTTVLATNSTNAPARSLQGRPSTE